jgi:hypothetical protein
MSKNTNKNPQIIDVEPRTTRATAGQTFKQAVIAGLVLFAIFGVMSAYDKSPLQSQDHTANAGEIPVNAQTAPKNPELENAEKQLEEAKAKVEGLKVPAPVVDDKTELPKEELKPEPKVEVAVASSPAKASTTTERSFKLNSGKYVKGSEILSWVKANPNGLKLWQAFNNKHGVEIADKAGISLFYENGTFKPDSIGVCSAKHMIGGDYRNCNYADLNSAGLDVGLKQINTFYQANRITKLGGEACTFGDSRDRNDPCNQKKLNWLLNVENNIKIALDIYSEQGFSPWYGAKRAGIV